MFKPGDRVVCIKSVKFPETVGACATVIEESQLAIDERREALPKPPICIRLDEPIRLPSGKAYADWRSWPECWRRIDGPSGESAESFVRQLTQPKVNA